MKFCLTLNFNTQDPGLKGENHTACRRAAQTEERASCTVTVTRRITRQLQSARGERLQNAVIPNKPLLYFHS